LDLTIGQVGPKFLDPLTPDVEIGLELLRATPRATIRAELQRVFAGQDKPVSAWVRNLADGDREEREIVMTAVRACHDLFIAPDSIEYERAFQQDISARMTDLRNGGIGAVLANLHPELRFRDDMLEMPHPRDQAMRLDGQGLELMPCATWPGSPMLTSAIDDPDRWMLIYSMAPGRAIRPDPATDALTPLIGATRAAVLRQLCQPMTTGTLASALGISAASVSEHTMVLRNSGLIDSHRSGRTVHHRRTAKGETLIADVA
jgi:DNA-binding transcriptional ArsR family regulator